MRPDFYLFGAAVDGAQLKALVVQLRQQLWQPAATAPSLPAPDQPLATFD
ncbi:hypothetical protein GCM10020295_79170 [Streptomyces cinereospinus]